MIGSGKRILFFFPFCFFAGAQGNEVRALQLVTFWKQSGYVVDVLSYENRDGRSWKTQQMLARTEINGELVTVDFGGTGKRAIRKLLFLMGQPLWGHSRIDAELIARFRKMVKKHVYSHVVISYVHYAYLLGLVSSKVSKLCDTHDIWTVVESTRGTIEFAHPAWPHLAHLKWPHLTLIFCLGRPSKSSEYSPGWFESG